MSTFTVKGVSLKKEIPDGKYGPAKVLALVLQEYGAANEVAAEWYTKAQTPMPQVGSRLEGTVEPSDHGPKFKKAQPGGFTGGRGGRSPETEKAISRMHAQEMALRYCAIRQAQGKLPETFGLNDGTRLIIDWFARDSEEGWKSKPSLPPAPQRSDVPNNFPGDPKPEANTPTEDIPF